MYISKHNYSIELAQLGNEVYYLEPAISSNKNETRVWQPLPELPNLKVITTYVPRWCEILRFKSRFLYNRIIPSYIARLLKKINVQFDITWCFETNLYSNLRDFKSGYIVYHPVDLAIYTFQKKIAATADIVFAISESVARDFRPYNNKVFFINHGLNKPFKDAAEASLINLKNGIQKGQRGGKIKVGFVGNLFRPELNKEFIKAAVSAHQDVQFHIWGPDELAKSNVDGASTKETLSFIDFLRVNSNVALHGVKLGKELAGVLCDMDILLLPLNISASYDGSNSHKIIEYLSTGKVVVSNYVETYDGTTLFEMIANFSTAELLALFGKVIHSLDQYNSTERQISRIEFSLKNTYAQHLIEMEELISSN